MSDRRKIVIRYIIDDTEAREATDRQRKAMRAVLTDADRTAKAQARADTQAARESERAWTKANNDRLREFVRIQREQAQAQARADRQTQQSAAADVRAWTKANNDVIREFRRVTAEREREARKASAIEAKAYREVVRAAQQSAREQEKALRDAAKSVNGIDSLVGTLKKLATGYLSVSTAMKAIDYLANSWESYNQTIKAGIVDLADYRKEVLALVALKDRVGQTTAETAEQIGFRSKTLQSRGEAIAFQEAAVGAGSSAIDKPGQPSKISEAEFDKFMEFAGAYQATRGVAADSMGTLAGSLPMLMGKQGVKADEASIQMARIFKTLDPGNFGSPGSSVDQLVKLAPSITTGVFKDVNEATTLMSALSTSFKDQAGDATNQITRATVGGIGSMKGPKLDAGDEAQKVGQYLRGLGMTAQNYPTDIAKAISVDMTKAEKAATGKGERFNAFDYLMHQGYGNQETRQALMAFHGMYQGGAAGNQFGTFEAVNRAPIPMMGPGSPQMEIAAYQAGDPNAQNRAVELATEAKNIKISAGPPETYLNMRRMAFNKLQAENPAFYSGSFDEWDKQGPWNAPFKAPVINEASRLMQEEAKRVGAVLPMQRSYVAAGMGSARVDINPLDYSFVRSSTSDANQAQAYFDAQKLIGEKGGDAIQATLDKLVSIAQQQLKLTEQQEQARRNGQINGQMGPQPRVRMPQPGLGRPG